jgi:UDP-GlcNAc:undecaprenyl-phosphate GlcNAc-1-phosphate transferase
VTPGDRWLAAFTVALTFALVGTPLLRVLAIRVHLVDAPATRKSHSADMPYMGGIALGGALLTGLLLQTHDTPQVGVVAVGAAGLAVLGLVDDDRNLSTRVRLAVEVLAAFAALVAGVQVHVTGVAAIDVALTLVWIVGITNAFNLLDNMDGLAAGVATACATGIFVLSAFGGEYLVATVAVAVCGACTGFLVYNWRPARIFMGDAGALLLGYVVAVAALEVTPALQPPRSFLVPVLLVAVPLLDTATVVVARVRRAIPVTRGGKDHLSHRLVARGMPVGRAVATLVGVQCVLAVLAVLAGRAVLAPRAAVAGALALLAVLAWWAAGARVYRERVVGFPPVVRLAVFALGATVGLAIVPLAVSAVMARGDLVHGRAEVEAGIAAARGGEAGEAARHFAAAGAALRRARGWLRSPLVGPSLAVPLLAPNVRAVRSSLDIGIELTAAGGRLASATDPRDLSVVNGVVPVDDVARMADEFDEAWQAIRRARSRLTRVDRGYLVAPVAHFVGEFAHRLDDAERDAYRGALAARVVPRVLGAGGERRYFVAVQNNAELRATGGFIGNWGVLTADAGRTDLENFARVDRLNTGRVRQATLQVPAEYEARYERFRPERNWQNVNMSPDFPATASVISQLLPQSGVAPVDGVIAVDPFGLAALLELTGPVKVRGWPEPITAQNVVDVTLRDAYDAFANRNQRAEFLGAVARRVWDQVGSVDLGNPVEIADTLAPAAREGHLVLWFQRAEEQRLVDELGISGRLGRPRGDALLAVSQNASANKLDYYLQRNVSYVAQLRPRHGTRVDVDAQLDVQLTNALPANVNAPEVIGPYDDRFAAGENLDYLSVYSPLSFTEPTLDGVPVTLEHDTEAGYRVASRYVPLDAGAQRRLSMHLRGTVPAPGGWYRLDLARQPSASADHARVVLRPAPGWRFRDARGARVAADGSATWEGELRAPRSVSVRMERTGLRGLYDRLGAAH